MLHPRREIPELAQRLAAGVDHAAPEELGQTKHPRMIADASLGGKPASGLLV